MDVRSKLLWSFFLKSRVLSFGPFSLGRKRAQYSLYIQHVDLSWTSGRHPPNIKRDDLVISGGGQQFFMRFCLNLTF